MYILIFSCNHLISSSHLYFVDLQMYWILSDVIKIYKLTTLCHCSCMSLPLLRTNKTSLYGYVQTFKYWESRRYEFMSNLKCATAVTETCSSNWYCVIDTNRHQTSWFATQYYLALFSFWFMTLPRFFCPLYWFTPHYLICPSFLPYSVIRLVVAATF